MRQINIFSILQKILMRIFILILINEKNDHYDHDQ